MIKEKDLESFCDGIAFTGASELTLDTIIGWIMDTGKKLALNITISKDIVVSHRKQREAITIHHTEHPKDYYRHCIIMEKFGNKTYVYFCRYGGSLNEMKINIQRSSNEGGLIQGIIGHTYGRVYKSEIEKEAEYYESLEQLFLSLGD